MTGKEYPNHDGKYFKYVCDCGSDTEYGIYRYKDDQEWCIDSCCGGGCYSAINIKYCPFCGKKIKVIK